MSHGRGDQTQFTNQRGLTRVKASHIRTLPPRSPQGHFTIVETLRQLPIGSQRKFGCLETPHHADDCRGRRLSWLRVRQMELRDVKVVAHAPQAPWSLETKNTRANAEWAGWMNHSKATQSTKGSRSCSLKRQTPLHSCQTMLLAQHPKLPVGLPTECIGTCKVLATLAGGTFAARSPYTNGGGKQQCRVQGKNRKGNLARVREHGMLAMVGKWMYESELDPPKGNASFTGASQDHVDRFGSSWFRVTATTRTVCDWVTQTGPAERWLPQDKHCIAANWTCAFAYWSRGSVQRSQYGGKSDGFYSD